MDLFRHLLPIRSHLWPFYIVRGEFFLLLTEAPWFLTSLHSRGIVIPRAWRFRPKALGRNVMNAKCPLLEIAGEAPSCASFAYVETSPPCLAEPFLHHFLHFQFTDTLQSNDL